MKNEARRFRLLVLTGLLLSLVGFGYLVCCDGDDGGPEEEKPCAAGCPEGMLCHPDQKVCVVFCNHPSSLCAAGQYCDINERRCLPCVEGAPGCAAEGEGEGEGEGAEGEGAEGEGEGAEGEGEGAEGEGEGAEGEGEGSGPVCGDGACSPGESTFTCHEDCHCPDGTCEEGEECPQDCSTEVSPVCGEALCPATECAGNLCHARQRCVEATCEPWACGEECKGSSKCVKTGETWECQPVACQEDQFGATNGAARTAARLVANTPYSLAFCGAKDDWFSFELPGGAGFVLEMAFSLTDIDLDIEFYRLVNNEPQLLAQLYQQAAGLKYIYNTAPGADGRGVYLLRVFQVSPVDVPGTEMYYSLRSRVMPGVIACSQDGDCTPETEVCHLPLNACQERDCRTNWTCMPDQFCNEETGGCDPLPCQADQFGGTNSAAETAASIVPDQLYDLSICEGEQDWFKFDVAAMKCVHVDMNFAVPAPSIDYDIDAALYDSASPEASPISIAMNRFLPNEDIFWIPRQAGTLYLKAHQARVNTYTLLVTVSDDLTLCSEPCSAENDPCNMRGGWVCDLERGLCLPPQ